MHSEAVAEFTLLNVTGNDADRDVTSRLLRSEGYRVLEATTGSDALRLVHETAVELVLLGAHLPESDAFELCRHLKDGVFTDFILVLHPSEARNDSSAHVRALEAGADACLTEPVEPELLLATVRSLLRTAGAKAELRRTRDELEARVAERTAALEAEVRERRQAEEQARKQAANAQALARAAAHFGKQLDLNAVLEAIYTYTAEALDVPIVTVSLYNNGQKQFEPAYAVGLPSHIIENLEPVPYEMTVQPPGNSSEPVITRDVQELFDLPNAELYRELDIRTTLNVNLLRKGELVGRLNVGTVGQPRDFAEGEITLLRGLADQAALALSNARLFEEVKAGREQLAELNRRLTKAEEEERRRLAQELHDSAGQLATALQMNLALIKASLPEGKSQQMLAEAETLAGELYEEIRQVAHSLRPPHLTVMGLNGVLEALCRQFSETVHLAIDYEGEELENVEDVVRITLYRITQEALTNIARHAGECEARVTLQRQDDTIQLTIKDNGTGFDTTAIMAAGKGIGLQGMQERLQLLNGRLDIHSQPGKGTRLLAHCPATLA